MCKDIGQYEINIGEWGSTEQGCRVTELDGQPSRDWTLDSIKDKQSQRDNTCWLVKSGYGALK